MNSTSDNAHNYDLKTVSTQREALEQMKSGLCTEVEGLRKQIQGKSRIISGINKILSETPHVDKTGE